MLKRTEEKNVFFVTNKLSFSTKNASLNLSPGGERGTGLYFHLSPNRPQFFVISSSTILKVASTAKKGDVSSW